METTPLTQARLKYLLAYDPETGIFTWATTRKKCRLGSVAGCLMQNGYSVIRVDNVLYTAHRLAWFFVHGVWPAEQLDHINGDRRDNRLVNLREATNAENAQNRKRRDNKSGYTGVRQDGKKWVATIKVNYKNVFLGRFDTPQDAAQAYAEAKQKMHPFSSSCH